MIRLSAPAAALTLALATLPVTTVALASPAHAAGCASTTSYTGNSDDDIHAWGDAANWSNGVPTATSAVEISGSPSDEVSVWDAVGTVCLLTVTGGDTTLDAPAGLTVTGTFTWTGGTDTESEIDGDITAAEIDVSDEVYYTGDGTDTLRHLTATGTLDVAPGADFGIGSDLEAVSAADVHLGADSTVWSNQSGSNPLTVDHALTLGGDATIGVNTGLTLAPGAAVDLDAHTLHLADSGNAGTWNDGVVFTSTGGPGVVEVNGDDGKQLHLGTPGTDTTVTLGTGVTLRLDQTNVRLYGADGDHTATLTGTGSVVWTNASTYGNLTFRVPVSVEYGGSSDTHDVWLYDDDTSTASTLTFAGTTTITGTSLWTGVGGVHGSRVVISGATTLSSSPTGGDTGFVAMSNPVPGDGVLVAPTGTLTLGPSTHADLRDDVTVQGTLVVSATSAAELGHGYTQTGTVHLGATSPTAHGTLSFTNAAPSFGGPLLLDAGAWHPAEGTTIGAVLRFNDDHLGLPALAIPAPAGLAWQWQATSELANLVLVRPLSAATLATTVTGGKKRATASFTAGPGTATLKLAVATSVAKKSKISPTLLSRVTTYAAEGRHSVTLAPKARLIKKLLQQKKLKRTKKVAATVTLTYRSSLGAVVTVSKHVTLKLK